MKNKPMEPKRSRFLTGPDDDAAALEKARVIENIAVFIAFLSVFGFLIKIIFF